MATHTYGLSLRWTGNTGAGTSGYASYSRDHELTSGAKLIAGSSDPTFRGDGSRWNPEELLVASLSQCHLLWYLHLASAAGVIVTAYADDPTGVMVEAGEAGGQFTEVVLRPTVHVTDESMLEQAESLHNQVGGVCFIARSVNFPVRHRPTTLVG